MRLLSIVAALVLGASTARAQFTPTVAPPRRRPVLSDSGARHAQAVRDTFPRTKLSDLRAWVDSVTGYAAGTLPAPGPAAPAAGTGAPKAARPRTPAADRPRATPR